MKNKIIYSFILIFSISLITSAKKTSDCHTSACSRVKQQAEKKTSTEHRAEVSSLSLFFFNI